MAAHALTIALGLIRRLENDPTDVGQVSYAMGYAPGWDDTLGFEDPPGASYRHFMDLVEAKDVEGIKAGLRAWVAVLEPVLRHFGSHEEYRTAAEAYIRYWKPYWRRRNDAWYAGKAPMPTEDRAPDYRKQEVAA